MYWPCLRHAIERFDRSPAGAVHECQMRPARRRVARHRLRGRPLLQRGRATVRARVGVGRSRSESPAHRSSRRGARAASLRWCSTRPARRAAEGACRDSDRASPRSVDACGLAVPQMSVASKCERLEFGYPVRCTSARRPSLKMFSRPAKPRMQTHRHVRRHRCPPAAPVPQARQSTDGGCSTPRRDSRSAC